MCCKCCKCGLVFYRQLLLLIAKCLATFSTGVCLAFPSVLIPAILAPDADIKATPDQASWIASAFGIGGLVGFAILPAMFEIYGRKITNIIASLVIFIGGLIFYLSNDIYSLFFARLTQGLSMGSSFISIMAISECISPKRRGYFLVLINVSIGFGSLACHALAFVFNWKQIAFFGAIPNCVSILVFIICAESPAFLAQQGKFEKCAKAFEWYRGFSFSAKNELNELITAQRKLLRSKEKKTTVNVLKKIKNIIITKEFQKSFFVVSLAMLSIDSCGRYFFVAYITQILIQLTSSVTSAMYISVLFDCILIFATCISSVLVRYFKRRTLLCNVGFFSVFLMFTVSLSIILGNRLKFIKYFEWVTLSAVLLHTFIINVGLVPVAFTLCGEIYSLKHRGLGASMSGVVSLTFFNAGMKLTPLMIDKTGVEGTYSIYGLSLCIFLVLLRHILPETKDKTLQQIEDEIKGVKRIKPETELIKYSEISNC